ncbi:hypothetical protein JKP88DRAFT_272934 [Tribonema minus]|uniref:Uncharacterized protein n=1 Tax=Tribonema minus TaxID=303371 RepID=A0A835YYB5_9STRA|nr:hypothetical protein JKP88DRAFT_272934 [Tribonema minus]
MLTAEGVRSMQLKSACRDPAVVAAAAVLHLQAIDSKILRAINDGHEDRIAYVPGLTQQRGVRVCSGSLLRAALVRDLEARGFAVDVNEVMLHISWKAESERGHLS